MPKYDYSIRDKLVQEASPYHFQRPFVQIGSNYPRTPQPAIQPNQLTKREEVGNDYWGSKMKEFEKETGIPAFRPRRVLNWRLL